MNQLTTMLSIGIIGWIGASAPARAQTYQFDVPAKLVNITFESRMEVEDILGSSNQVSGAVTREGDGKVSFRVNVPVTSLKTGIAMRDQHLQSATWLDAGRYPQIVLEGRSAHRLAGGKWRVKGTFTLRGVSSPLEVDVEVREIPRQVASRAGLGDTDWIRVRGAFTVRLSAHGIKIPGMVAAKVSDTWTVKVSLFAKRVR